VKRQHHRCRACLKRGHNRKTCPKPLHPGKYYYRGRWRSVNAEDDEPVDNQYHGLDDYILKHVGRMGVSSRDLHQRVVDDYGPVGERTFLRHLRVLRETRQLSATARPYRQGFMYARD
jgi:hypothetical protein